MAPARLFVLAAVALFLLGLQAPVYAQNHLPSGSVGKITGDDISVEGGVFPTSVKGATSLFVSSGSVLTVHSGTAELALAGGAVVDACGPAKFTVLESGGAFTLALNFGRVRVRAGNGAAIRIFTPFIVANPISISEIGTDFTIGLDVKDSVCVYAGEGAATLEQQFGGQNLVVPTTSEFMLAGERLNPVEAPVGSCRCTYTAPPPRVNGAGVTTATSNGPPGHAPGGTGAGSGNGASSTAEGASSSTPASTATVTPAANEASGGAAAGTNAAPAAAPIEASAAPAPENPAEAKVEPPVSNGGNATTTKPADQPAQENAQTASTQGPESAKPAASPGIAIDLGHAATPAPAPQAATAQPAGSAPGSTPPANASGSTPAAASDNSPAFAGKLNQTPPSGVEMSSSGSPTPPQIKDPQFKAAPAPLSYQAPPPPIEVAQMVNVQAQSKQGFMVDGHVEGKSGGAAKSEGTPKASATTATPTATKPRKPYQAPGTGFWSKFKRLFSKPAPAPKPEDQP